MDQGHHFHLDHERGLNQTRGRGHLGGERRHPDHRVDQEHHAAAAVPGFEHRACWARLASYKLQVAQTATCGSGTYSDVTTSTSGHWAVTDTAYYTNGDATTNVSSGLTDPGGYTFQAGQTLDTSGSTGTINLNAATFTEIEFAVQATDNAILGANYCFRLYDATAGTTFDTYTNYGQAIAPGYEPDPGALPLAQRQRDGHFWHSDGRGGGCGGYRNGFRREHVDHIQRPGAGRDQPPADGRRFVQIHRRIFRGRSRAVCDLERPQPRPASNIRSTVTADRDQHLDAGGPAGGHEQRHRDVRRQHLRRRRGDPVHRGLRDAWYDKRYHGFQNGRRLHYRQRSVTTSANDLVLAVLSTNNSSVAPTISTGTSRWSQKLRTLKRVAGPRT